MINAESYVLGSIINAPQKLLDVLSYGIKVGHFAEPDHVQIFQAIIEADEKKEPFDLVGLSYRMGDRFISKIADIAEQGTMTQNLEFYCQEILRDAFVRRFNQTVVELDSLARGAKKNGTIAQIQASLLEHVDVLLGNDKKSNYDSQALTARFEKLIDDAYEAKRLGRPFGYPTGIEMLDKTIHGFRPQALYILGARPGVGKSELLCNFAHNLVSANHACGFFTFEMTGEEITARIISRLSGVNDTLLFRAAAKDHQLSDVRQALTKFETLPLYVVDDCKPNWAEVKVQIRQLVRRHGIKVVFIDYIQQLNADGFTPANRVRELSHISTDAKNLARELNIAIVCAAQLNRQSADREDEPPQKRHLKESGSLEQDANVVMLIHRMSTGAMNLIVDKNRHGSEGVIPIRVNFETHTVEDGR